MCLWRENTKIRFVYKINDRMRGGGVTGVLAPPGAELQPQAGLQSSVGWRASFAQGFVQHSRLWSNSRAQNSLWDPEKQSLPGAFPPPSLPPLRPQSPLKLFGFGGAMLEIHPEGFERTD